MLGGLQALAVENLTGSQFPAKIEQGIDRSMILTGTPSVRCRSTATTCSSSPTRWSSSTTRPGRRARATCCSCRRRNRIAAERLEFNTKTRTGTFYNASGIVGIAERGVDRSLFGTQEPDALLLGRRDRQARPEDLQDHPRRVHDLRAADAALGDRRRLGDADARRPRGPDQHGPAR